MTTTDVVGWASLAAFVIGFIVLYRFITSPSKKLEKLVGDGSVVGLERIREGSADWERVVDFVSRSFGACGKNFNLGAVYKAKSLDGYLFSMVRMWKVRRQGGVTTRHEDLDKCAVLGPTTLQQSFSVKLKQELTVTGRMLMSVASSMGVDAGEIKDGLLDEFKEHFSAYRKSADGEPAIPEGLQKLLARHARESQRRWGLLSFLKEQGSIDFSQDSFVVNLSRTKRPKSREHVAAILEFAEQVRKEIAA